MTKVRELPGLGPLGYRWHRNMTALIGATLAGWRRRHFLTQLASVSSAWAVIALAMLFGLSG